MTPPLVSVVMINYNGLPWLTGAVESVLASEEVAFELIVVDDGSKDDSRGYLDEMVRKDARVRKVFLPQNLGISGARNAGIDVALGDFISIIDSDDRFLPDTLKRQVETFRKLAATEPRLSLLMSDAWLINEAGNRVGRYISHDWWDRETTVDPPLWTLPSTFFFKREGAARFHPGYRSADGPIFVRRMEKVGALGFTGYPLIEYRLRMSSVTNASGDKMLREMNAAEQSYRDGRLENPLDPDEIPAPRPRDVAAWTHGRNAKNAAANGRKVRAACEFAKAALAQPAGTFQKMKRVLRSFGKRIAG
ncbi:glycosyltransferase family 2 protein [Luteolibacter flavescens]|uniref:Glycosyltransferase family 2 protein n=1 Tax=Luteolibacter flavescens TaxID=1859460 RepID=A0ABT3FNW3_9BACT|nr:glycosyltransferase family 2 protein [Luteolibacter flavescens]MCW1885157.1 glycosyltransferase family 2 protein [Luteolibacter flavescens]